MSDMQHQLAALTASLFSPNVKSAGDVRQAARYILKIHSALLDLDCLLEELVARGNNVLAEDAASQWKIVLRRIGPLGQMMDGKEPQKANSVEGKISWIKVQLMSYELQQLAASLRSQYVAFSLHQVGLRKSSSIC